MGPLWEELSAWRIEWEAFLIYDFHGAFSEASGIALNVESTLIIGYNEAQPTVVGGALGGR